MKTIILAATLATLSMGFAAPMQAASITPVLASVQALDGSAERHGGGRDNKHDISERPKGTHA